MEAQRKCDQLPKTVKSGATKVDRFSSLYLLVGNSFLLPTHPAY